MSSAPIAHNRVSTHYDHKSRTHFSLDEDATVPRAVQSAGRIVAIPRVGRLHHRYVAIAKQFVRIPSHVIAAEPHRIELLDQSQLVARNQPTWRAAPEGRNFLLKPCEGNIAPSLCVRNAQGDFLSDGVRRSWSFGSRRSVPRSGMVSRRRAGGSVRVHHRAPLPCLGSISWWQHDVRYRCR